MLKYPDKVDYCKKERRSISKYEEIMHIEEVDFVCPLCGARIYEKTSKNKSYEIAHIFPHSPTEKEKTILTNVELLGNDSESFDNKIALCINCHRKYDNQKTITEYNQLINIKKRLLSNLQTKKDLTQQHIEKDIINVLESIANITDEQLSSIEEYKNLNIDKKIGVKYQLLRRKVKLNVSMYYTFIEEQLRNLDEIGKKFRIIASQIHTAYLMCKNENQEDIFNSIVNWLYTKDIQMNKDACVIVISFFVQNCEVFDEIA